MHGHGRVISVVLVMALLLVTVPTAVAARPTPGVQPSCAPPAGTPDTSDAPSFCLHADLSDRLITLTLSGPPQVQCALDADYLPTGKSILRIHTRSRTSRFAIDPTGRYGNQVYATATCSFLGKHGVNLRAVTVQLPGRIYGAWSCSAYPAPALGTACVLVTQYRQVVSIVVSATQPSECLASATYFPSLTPARLAPDGAALRQTDKDGIILYTFSSVGYAHGGDHLLVAAECAPTGAAQYTLVNVDFQLGHLLRLSKVPTAEGTVTPTAQAVLPTETATPAAPSPRLRPGGLQVRVSIQPAILQYGDRPTVVVVSSVGASCLIQVRYTSGQAPTSYPDHARLVNAQGRIVEQGSWHVENHSGGGTVTARCRLGNASGSDGVHFSIQ